MAKFEASEALVQFHMEYQRMKDHLVRLEGQNASYKITIESLVTENAHNRETIVQLETQLQEKWIRNEVLTETFNRIELNIATLRDAIK